MRHLALVLLVAVGSGSAAQTPCVDADLDGRSVAESYLGPSAYVEASAGAQVDALALRTWVHVPCEGRLSALADTVRVLWAAADGLPARARGEFVHGLIEAVRTGGLAPGPLALLLLSTPSGAEPGLDFLRIASPRPLEQPGVQELVLDVLRSPETAPMDRLGMLTLFAAYSEEQWLTVDADARALVDTLESDELRYDAAGVLARALRMRGDLDSVYTVEASRPGALRTALAFELVREGVHRLVEAGVQDPVGVVMAAAADSTLPASVRGDAIWTLGWRAEEPPVRDVLVDLLEPERWFFGVQATYTLNHSTAMLVDVLTKPARQGDPVVRAAFARLANRLDLIGEGADDTRYYLGRVDAP